MKIILLTNNGFVGDNNQLKGIQSAIQAKIKEQVEFVEIEESMFNINLLGDDDIVLVSGSHGLLMADLIKQNTPKTSVIWSGHQYFSEFKTLNFIPDIVALPETALSESEKVEIAKKTRLVLTTGVAHSVNDKTVSDDRAKFTGELPDHNQFSRQIGIILAGDAPNSDGQMKFFTEEDARRQASLLVSSLKDNGYDTNETAIMLTNGPRTGKHNPVTGLVNEPDPHRSGQIDPSSRAFLEVIQSEMAQSKIFFYDFQFSELKFGPSAYKPMIKQVADSQSGLWFVPAESTSMVTESSYFLESKTPVVIYHPSSENSTHLAHAEDAVRQGFAVDVADKELSFRPSKAKMESAATKIAEAFYQNIVLGTRAKVSLVRDALYNVTTVNNDIPTEENRIQKSFS